MSLYHKLSRKPQLFLSVTGMNLHQFQTLLPQFTHAHDKFARRRKRKVVVVTGKKRQRQIGGGAQFANSLPDRLLMLLLYYRLYLTQEFMTLLFKAEDKSVIGRSLQSLMASSSQSANPKLPRSAKATTRGRRGSGTRSSNS